VCCGRRELVEINRGVGRDLGAGIIESAIFGAVLAGSDGSKMDHGLVTPSHELNCHILPCSGRTGVAGPSNMAILPFSKCLVWTRCVGFDHCLGEQGGGGRKDGGEEDGCKHIF